MVHVCPLTISHQPLTIEMDRIRTFIAVRLPAEVRRRLMSIEERLMESRADVKWVPEENFHITLKFLGPVEHERIAAVCEAVECAVTGVRPFEMTFAGVGAFPRPSSPRVVWVGTTSGADEMKSLAGRIENAMEVLGFPKEDRPFSGHVTLGRVRSPRATEKLRDCIESLRDERAGKVQVDGVSVMKSELFRSGSEYSSIADLGFQIDQKP